MRVFGIRRLGVAAVLAAAVAAAVVNFAGSASIAKASSKTPILIGDINSNTGQDAMPGLYPSVQVGVNAVNAAGGVNGHPLKLVFCDDQSIVQDDILCSEKLLRQDHVSFLVGDDTLTSSVMPALVQAKSISWGDFAANPQAQSSLSVFDIYPSYVLEALLPRFFGSAPRRIAMYSPGNAAAIQGENTIGAGLPKQDAFQELTLDPSSTDFLTPCEQAKTNNDNTALAFTAQSQIAPMMEACQQLGLKITWIVVGGELNTSTVQAMTKFHISSIIPYAFDEKAVQKFDADIAKYGPKDPNPVNDESLSDYLAVKLLPRVLKNSGAVSASGKVNVAKIRAFVNKQKTFNMEGFTNPINFTAANHPLGTSLARLKNRCGFSAQISSTGKVVVSSTPLCL